ncbi:hypothetical protein [Stappia indica]|uniref:Two-component response regulator, PleD family, consists of two REC domains and a diguanylate cyclase (GGDEF) domain n=1 Tax=Stappia indica TaxID=538381 RepID=A0A285S8C1_9HYPH|nr:hypothetical protein [Stappia indica]SOC03708.1 Two-component response regulator, PleD family, consists of two REC domains and a diguanylate cyclase (GGDEF) domain [Stappia indica]
MSGDAARRLSVLLDGPADRPESLLARLGHAWGDLAEIAWADTPPARLPDVVVSLPGKTARRFPEAPAKGVHVPRVVLCPDPVADADGIETHLPDAFLSSVCPPELALVRLAETVRQARRMEEARLRRSAFGPLAAVQTRDLSRSIPVLVAGDSARIGVALGAHLAALDLRGCLTADAALAALEEAPARLMVIDLPASRASELLARLRADARHITLPVLALCADEAEAAALLTSGASDCMLRAAAPQVLARHLLCLLRAGARRALADRVLAGYRPRRGLPLLPREAYERYLAALGEALALRGAEPLPLLLAQIAPPPLASRAANDDPFAGPVVNPVLSATLAASRDEDFVARVEELGDIAVLRDAEAQERIRQRIGAIVASTAFA